MRPGNKTKKRYLLADRIPIEVFADDGAVSVSSCFLPQENAWYGLSTYGVPWTKNRRTKIVSLEEYERNSID